MPRLVREIDFDFGDIVYLKVREERVQGMVTGINCRPDLVTYNVQWGNDSEGWYLGMELDRTFERRWQEDE